MTSGCGRSSGYALSKSSKIGESWPENVVRASRSKLVVEYLPLGFACLISHHWNAGLSVVAAIFPEITLVSGRRWKWRLRPSVAYFFWWKSYRLCRYALFIGGLIHACFDNLCKCPHKLQECQSMAGKYVHKRRKFKAVVSAVMK